ncbi:aldose epimerase family protein [Dysgonomonas sp. 520]|uniref:aldose epimerase family protein n=1 Tax=Dysgonomonas sp. 520 TaxID=2302931 RepID=UPI0013D22453|nr:aldose epimerase family protein [Dysgonomonas sp. 520]NDW09790.1 galactose mutarotase [Dysgonomonas sp. 520]
MNANNKIELLKAEAFDASLDGKKIALYTLESGNGITMQVTNFGGRVVTLWVPDKAGNYEDIVVGYENIDRYLNNTGERFLGCVVGRYANRIANGKFTIDNVEYTLPVNNATNSLHGGLKGLDSVVWDVDKVSGNEIHFSYTSPDGEEGYPGTVKYKMVYTLTPDNEFKIAYEAETDKATHVNLSHHSYFNLKGEGNGDILDYMLTINADKYTPYNEVNIPTGEIASVKDTPFDFLTSYRIGERIDNDNEQLKFGAGYDHNWVINKEMKDGVEFAASVYEPSSGRVMEVWTDQPGIQFYASNWFDGSFNGKYGKPINRRAAIALETQKYPDTPNKPEFPSTRLNPGEVYKQTCIYKFLTK